nr:maltose acetyltransferase domain-containing protein [Nitrospira japonica]
MAGRQKMLAGELYYPMDEELIRARERARHLCQTLNTSLGSINGQQRSTLIGDP